MSDPSNLLEQLLEEMRLIRSEISDVKDVVPAKLLEMGVVTIQGMLRLLCDRFAEPMRVTDSQGLVRMMNAPYCELVGMKQQELQGQPFDIILTNDERAPAMESYTQKFLAGSFEPSVEQRVVLWNQKRLWLESSHTLLECFTKEPLLLSIIRDVTKRKLDHRELKSNASAYFELFDNAPDALYVHDLAGNLTFLNKTGERIAGYTRAEALRMNIAQILAPESVPLAKEMLDKKLRGKRSTTYEVEMLTKDGRKVAVEICSRLIIQNDKPVAVQGSAREITARKLLEEKLQQAQKTEAISRLTAGVAHDFNNMLTIIIGYSDMLLKTPLPPAFPRDLLQEIRTAAGRSEVLTRQLLAFSRKQVVQPQVLSLNSLVAEVQKMLSRLIGEDVKFQVHLDPEAGSIKADRGQIEQILLNLVVNARDAMPKGGSLTLETSNVELSEGPAANHPELPPGSYVQIKVTDTGFGMDDSTKARIFEPFFTTKDPGKGTGLGLATVATVLEQSGGHVEVFSKLGQGTTFQLFFPRVHDAGVSETIGSVRSATASGKETILLVEDEDQLRALVRSVLEGHGYKILEARDGLEALDVSARYLGQIQLLITDVVLPHLSGGELALQIAAKRPTIKVLCLSGYTDSAVVRHGVLRHEMAFLQKPFAMDVLAKTVRQILDR